MDPRKLNTPRKIQARMSELEAIRESLAQARADFIRRCNQAFREPPLTIQFAPHRELVWRKRVAVTGGPQSTVEFYTPAGRKLLASLQPRVLSRYLDLEKERILLNMQYKMVQSELQHIRHFLGKHANVKLLKQQEGKQR